MKKKYGKSCADRQIERCFDWNKLNNSFTEDANCDYLIYYGRMTKIDVYKGRKHRICPVCGKGFYRKNKNGGFKKYCSKECAEKANTKKNVRISNLGTPATSEINLNDPESIHREVERIRRGGSKPVYESIGPYELESKKLVYRME